MACNFLSESERLFQDMIKELIFKSFKKEWKRISFITGQQLQEWSKMHKQLQQQTEQQTQIQYQKIRSQFNVIENKAEVFLQKLNMPTSQKNYITRDERNEISDLLVKMKEQIKTLIEEVEQRNRKIIEIINFIKNLKNLKRREVHPLKPTNGVKGETIAPNKEPYVSKHPKIKYKQLNNPPKKQYLRKWKVKQCKDKVSQTRNQKKSCIAEAQKCPQKNFDEAGNYNLSKLARSINNGPFEIIIKSLDELEI